MIGKDYSSEEPSNNYVRREMEGIISVIGMAGLEMTLSKAERVKKWQAIGEDHRN